MCVFEFFFIRVYLCLFLILFARLFAYCLLFHSLTRYVYLFCLLVFFSLFLYLSLSFPPYLYPNTSFFYITLALVSSISSHLNHLIFSSSFAPSIHSSFLPSFHRSLSSLYTSSTAPPERVVVCTVIETRLCHPCVLSIMQTPHQKGTSVLGHGGKGEQPLEAAVGGELPGR